MIYVLCIEDNKLYQLSGDDDNFKIVEVLTQYGSVTPLTHNPLKMHKEDFLRRVAEAKLAGFNAAFHCHVRAYRNACKELTSKISVISIPRNLGRSQFYNRLAKMEKEYEKSNPLPIEYKPGP